MGNYKIENLSFGYREKIALEKINLTVQQGEFVTVCGKSGCGKTTLLRLLKPALSPSGSFSGDISFNEEPLSKLSQREQAEKIGFVMQNPENQIVTDKVWHELAFGLESIGTESSEIHQRVAEMAAFFGIEAWFECDTAELSGGQKQMLNLASVMVMNPEVLVLDEPTSQLDPIAAHEFLETLHRVNRELGITVILSEHRLEEVFSMSDRMIILDEGHIIADDEPRVICELLKENDMYEALPVPVRIWGAVENELSAPLTVREGRAWLEEFSRLHSMNQLFGSDEKETVDDIAVEIKGAWFRYGKNLPDVVRGLNLQIRQGEIFTIMGGNGAGKTTALSLIAGLHKAYKGTVKRIGSEMAMVPQNPEMLFVKKRVLDDLLDILDRESEKETEIKKVAELCEIGELLDRHPYDLSGGEKQRTALAKVLLKKPKILLLDEPTKGMDAHFKKIFAEILSELRRKGVAVIMVSHDIEFCAENADRCAFMFGGEIVSQAPPRRFFAGKSFYTTAANRMARRILPEAVTAEDIITACGGEIKEETRKPEEVILPETRPRKEGQKKTASVFRVCMGLIFLLAFVFTWKYGIDRFEDWKNIFVQVIVIFELLIGISCFVPTRGHEIKGHKSVRKLTKRNVISALTVIIAVPLTIFAGMYMLDDKRYYFISIMVILETFIPFAVGFESRKPKARELVIISVLCAIAVAGRMAFAAIPQFKPMMALIIISAICFGGETGFLVGAVTAFVSNFFFGQGPWTPWQMLSFGMSGFLAGCIDKIGFIKRDRLSLAVFGAAVTVFIYGGIANPTSVFMMTPEPTADMFISAYVMGFPLDLVHAASTAFFLWFAGEPMLDKLERVKKKFGIDEK